MTSAYWSQWSHSELMSMHGIELDECHDDDDDCVDDVDESECDEDACPRCSGGGCNYCLMCEW